MKFSSSLLDEFLFKIGVSKNIFGLYFFHTCSAPTSILICIHTILKFFFKE